MAREMKDSGIEWIGEIPADWLVLPVKSLYNFETGFTPPTEKNEYYCGDGETWITISDLTKPIVNDSQTKILEDYAKQKGTLHSKGSLLYSFKLSVGKKAILGCNAYTNEAIAVFDAKINPCIKYLYYSIDFVEYNANENIYGAKLLNRELIQNAPIIFPSITEQQRIASFLDTKCAEIDKAIEATKSSIEEYKKLRQAIITGAVTKGLDPNVEMKDSGVEWIGKIPSKWNVKKLRFLGFCQNGISKGAEFFGDEGFPFVSYSDVYKNIHLPIPLGTINSSKEEQKLYSVKKGDIFFTRTSETIEEIGFSSVCLETIPEATFAGFLIRVRPTTGELNERFSSYYFRSDIHRLYFIKEMNLVTRASLGQTLLKNLPVLIPPINEQVYIADFLDTKCAEIDSLIKSKEKLIEELTAYRKSLIFEYVTGKKEVPAV